MEWYYWVGIVVLIWALVELAHYENTKTKLAAEYKRGCYDTAASIQAAMQKEIDKQKGLGITTGNDLKEMFAAKLRGDS